MNAARALLEMLKGYEVQHVFGLPGETTLPLYKEWLDFPEIEHVMARDERSTAFMADVYARFTFKPGLCEAPSVGSTHLMPGMAEAYKASVPVIAITSDIPLHLERWNMLTGIDQEALFKGVSKETITATNPQEIPSIVRRAFRVATSGRPGPIHIRLPHDVQSMEVESPRLHIQKDFIHYPGHRPSAQKDKIVETVKLLGGAERPVMVLGQGVLLSGAWDESVEVAELFAMPTGTTINGKGAFPESHPLSIGVIGARGGTSLSNKVLCEADVVFFVGTNTDSAGTDKWTCPPLDGPQKIIHLDISETHAGNVYPTDVLLIGDAKATLKEIIDLNELNSKKFKELPRIARLLEEKKEQSDYVTDLACSGEEPIHPVCLVKGIEEFLPDDYAMVMDVGTAAIYTSTFFKTKKPGRQMAYNFAMGALGFAIPGAIGARVAKPNSCIVGMVGDGSFGLTVGELETVKRLGGNLNLIVFNNSSYGWIKAEWLLSHGQKYVDFATNFNQVDYMKIAEGYGLDAFRISKPTELDILKEAFNSPNPSLIEVISKPENELVPPVPKWINSAKKKGIRHIK